jgi:hypothetical protein
MTHVFAWGDNGIVFQTQLPAYTKATLFTLKLSSCGFKPSSIRVDGTFLQQVMISKILLASSILTITPYSLSVITSFKGLIDRRIADQTMRPGDSLSFYLENRHSAESSVVLYLDGKRTS